MKTYIIESHVLTAVVGVNDSDKPIDAVNKFLCRHGASGIVTECGDDRYTGTWSATGDRFDLEGTYTLRTLIV
jgi:hypothetical protein